MADHEIKTKLKLQGEDEYNSKIKASYQQLRVLNSELKREQSALKSSATEQEKAKLKADVLKRKIEEQKKIVAELEKALKQARTQYSDNVQVQNEWEIKLNRATTTLNNMTRQLEGATNCVNGLNNSMAQTGQRGVQAMVSINDTVKDMQHLFSDLGNIVKGVFDGIVENITTTITIATDMIAGAMAQAAQWTSIMEMYGGNTQNIEQFMRTANFASAGSASSIPSYINKLITNTHNGNKDTMAALAQLGIDEEGFDNHWDYFQAVWEAVAGQEDRNKRLALAADLFGDRNGSAVNGIIDNWGRGQSEYKRNIEETGIVLSADEIATMNDANNKINEISQTWDALKDKLGTQLWIKFGLDETAENALTLLDDVGKLFFGEGDKKEIVAKLTVDLQTFLTGMFNGVDSVATWLQEIANALSESEDPTIKALGGLVQSVTNFLNFITAHQTEIINALQAFVDFKLSELKMKLDVGFTWTELFNAIKSIAVDIGNILIAGGLIKNSGTLGSLLGFGKNGTTTTPTSTPPSGGSSILNMFGGVTALPTMFASYIYGLVKVGQYGNEHPENAPTNEEYVTNGIDPTTEQGAELSQALADVAQASDDLVTVMDNNPFSDESQAAQDNYKAAQATLAGMQGGQELLNKFLSWRNYNPSESMTDFLADELGVTPQQPTTGKKSFVSSPVQAPEVIVDDLCDFIEEEILGVDYGNVEGIWTDLVAILNGEDYGTDSDIQDLQDQLNRIYEITDPATYWQRFRDEGVDKGWFSIPEEYEFDEFGRPAGKGGDVNLTVDVKLDGATVAQNQIGYIGPMIYDQLMTR